jgi:DNA polymerase (family 10)
MHIREQQLRTQLNVVNVISRKLVAKWAKDLPKYVTICGSYRRNVKELGDIDIIVPVAKFSEVITALAIQVYVCGTEQCSGFINVGGHYVQIDVCAYAPNERAYMMLYFTGSKQFNIMMRAIAKKKGYLLNQRGLVKLTAPTKYIKAIDEISIFKKLGMDYVRAEDRV